MLCPDMLSGIKTNCDKASVQASIAGCYAVAGTQGSYLSTCHVLQDNFMYVLRRCVTLDASIQNVAAGGIFQRRGGRLEHLPVMGKPSLSSS